MKQTFTLFLFTFFRYCFLVVGTLLPLLGRGQTTLARQDFEATPATPTAAITTSGSGGSYASGSTAGSGDAPANSPYYTSASRGYARTGTGAQVAAVVTSAADLNTTGYAGLQLSLRLASFSVGSTTQGADGGDVVTVEISKDGGATWSSELTVNGNNNARWAFSATGTASATYDGDNAPTAVQSGAGTQAGSGGIATLTVSGLPAVAALRFRISLNNDIAAERWVIDDIVLTGTATPTLAVSAAALSGFSAPVGTASAAQSYTLTGSSLTADVRVTPPAGYEVSQTSSTTGFAGDATALTVPQADAAAGKTIYVRLSASATGTPSGNVANTSPGAIEKDVAVTSTASTPSLTATALYFSGRSIPATTYLGSQLGSTTNFVDGFFNLYGSNLGTTPITIKAPAGFQVATDETSFGTADGNTLTVAPSNGSVSTTLYVRLTGAALGDYTGTVTMASGPASATVAAAGTVYDYFERFESGISNTYATTPTTYTLSTGKWTGYNTLAFASNSDAFIDARSVRIQGVGYLDFTAPNGVGTLSFLAAYYGSDSGAALTVQVSADGGTTYTTVAPTASAALQTDFPAPPFSYVINQLGPLHIRIGSTASGKRLNVDNVGLTQPTLAAAPTALAFAAIPGETTAAQTYTLTGTGLPATGTVSISASSSALQLSLDGISYGTAPLAVGLTGNTLSRTVYVRYAAPTGNGGTSTSYTINHSIGTLAASVAVGTTDAAVYTWSASGSAGSWSAPGSWTPARTSPASTDVLRFTSGSAASTAVLDYGGGSQTIGQLLLGSGQAATFSTDASRTLLIGNGSVGNDLAVGSGAALTCYTSGSAAGGLVVQLGSGATASVAGHLTFDAAAAGTGQHQLLGSGAANSVEFAGGGVFTAAAGFSGYAFAPGTGSTGLAGNVVFRNNSRYERIGGGNPFVLPAPAAVTSFEPGSTFVFAPTSVDAPSLGGRTYGHLEYNLPGLTATSTESGLLTVAGNLILTAGTANLNLPGGVLLLGNILLNGGALGFDPATAATVQVGGAAAQRIGGSVAGSGPAFGANATLQLNNAAGLTLGQPVSVAGVLQLSSGLLTTDATNILTLTSTATVAEGSNASFVNGPVRRPVGPASSAASYVFPVGKGAAYRPLTLLVNTQTGTTYYRAEQVEGSPGQSLASPDASGTALTRVSRVRYFSLTPYNNDAVPVITQPTGFSGSVRLTFGPDDAVTSPAAATLVVAKRGDSTKPWSNFGRASYTGTASGGTLTSGNFTSFSDFALASTAADPAPNPLPVQLTAFAAVRSGAGPVGLAWTTAAELHSELFVIERSADGQAFEPVAQVTAQGSSTQAHHYEARDAAAPAARLYYRLRVVDTDGSSSYSVVAAVGGLPGELALSPNPAREQLSFYTEQAAPYVLRSALGQVVHQGTTAAGGLTQLEVRVLASGVYFLEVHAAAGRVVRRFVKE